VADPLVCEGATLPNEPPVVTLYNLLPAATSVFVATDLPLAYHVPIVIIGAVSYPVPTSKILIAETEPDDRTIYWYWCEKGKSGKTTFAKYLSYHYGAIPLEGKKNDILFTAAEYDSNIYIFDLERSMEGHVSYAALEKIKNGFYMVGKYEGKPIIRNSPHVIVFANFAPDEEKLSQDRWKVKHL